MTKRPGMFDLKLPFFNPLWIRLVTTLVPLGWGAMELVGGNIGWATIFGAAGLYAAWAFFVTWTPQPEPGAEDKGGDP